MSVGCDRLCIDRAHHLNQDLHRGRYHIRTTAFSAPPIANILFCRQKLSNSKLRRTIVRCIQFQIAGFQCLQPMSPALGPGRQVNLSDTLTVAPSWRWLFRKHVQIEELGSATLLMTSMHAFFRCYCSAHRTWPSFNTSTTGSFSFLPHRSPDFH